MPAETTDHETSFQRWLQDPENAIDADLLIANFVAEDGVEMLFDLLNAPAAQLQPTAQRWLARLRERFDRFLREGEPLRPAPAVKVSFWTGSMERAAEELLASKLPPDLSYSFTSRHRVPSDNPAHSTTWVCTIDGGASGEGTTPIQAARKAIESWQAAKTSKPPQLNAPSTPAAPNQEQQKQVS
jgi:hypothetical protein